MSSFTTNALRMPLEVPDSRGRRGDPEPADSPSASSVMDVPLVAATRGWLGRVWPSVKSGIAQGARWAWTTAQGGATPVTLVALAVGLWYLSALIGQVLQVAVAGALLYALFYAQGRPLWSGE